MGFTYGVVITLTSNHQVVVTTWQCPKQDWGFARFELVVLHENWPEKMGLIFPRAAFSKSAIKTLASKWEQGSRSLGCSGTMFRRDGPRFSPRTGLVPEPNFMNKCDLVMFRGQVALSQVKLHWVSALPAKSPMLPLWFGWFCIWYHGSGSFDIIFLLETGLVPEPFLDFCQKPYISGTI